MVWNSASSTLYKAVERHNSEAAMPMREEVKPCCELPPQHSEPPKCSCTAPQQHSGMLSELLKDRDFLLIAALMLILMHEKADNKLILALAFVLFS